MFSKITDWKKKHPDIFEFIMFNLLANIATITNFIVLLIGDHILFKSLADIDFNWGPFHYPVGNGGMSSFLSFLLSYACAQTVNFIVQRKMVFNADNKLGKAIPIYILTVFLVYIICLYVPTLIMAPLSGLIGGAAIYAANCVNILIQVIIFYPAMKFLIMKKSK
ncbi:GtrA family protein [Konateibacter massiliensis]|uniref:GtrA family protein n=1 Tax=Konateibacter massiliensis TaxID=2002841 RepID=UPI000C1613C3|nr:GtrA family protein [Konateibacter massiliensis]